MPVHTEVALMPSMSKLLDNSTSYFASLPVEEAELYIRLSHGRAARIASYCCWDAVMDLSKVFGLEPGMMGEHRNAGNVVPHFTQVLRLAAEGKVDAAAASVDVALSSPNLEAIGVIGHQDCAFCKAALLRKYGPDMGRFEAWVNLHGPTTREMVINRLGDPPDPEDAEKFDPYLWEVVKLHTQVQYYNLMSYPGVARRVEEGALTPFAAVLQLTPKPQLVWFNQTLGDFRPRPARQSSVSAE
jgi:carbonic anhydrase